MQQFSIFVPSALIAVGFAAQIFVQWRTSIGKAKDDGLDNYKKIVESYEKRIETMSRDHKDEVSQLRILVNSHTEKLGHMKALIEEKDKQLKDYLEILQEKDPDSKMIAEVAKQGAKHMKAYDENLVIVNRDIQQIKAQVGALHDFLLAKTVEKIVVPPGSPQGTTI